ncbi:MAG: recombinase [Spirochaetes bacterium]|nr:MAG: recombinase [Spirochaetota bacterium]
MAKHKKSERQRAKQRAWEAFSRYIRTRDCIATTGSPEYGRCITCGQVYPFGKLDAGHFIPGRSDAVLFEEHNCHAQGIRCNRFAQGAFVEYEMALRELYGEEEVERLKQLKFKTVKYSLQDFIAIKKKYTALTSVLRESCE